MIFETALFERKYHLNGKRPIHRSPVFPDAKAKISMSKAHEGSQPPHKNEFDVKTFIQKAKKFPNKRYSENSPLIHYICF